VAHLAPADTHAHTHTDETTNNKRILYGNGKLRWRFLKPTETRAR
jgi:hypothetical protein